MLDPWFAPYEHYELGGGKIFNSEDVGTRTAGHGTEVSMLKQQTLEPVTRRRSYNLVLKIPHLSKSYFPVAMVCSIQLSFQRTQQPEILCPLEEVMAVLPS